MIKKLKKIFVCLFTVLSVTLFFSGCWDSRELDSLFIVTAIGIDAGAQSETVALTLEIGPTDSNKSSKEGGMSQKGTETLLLQSTAKTIGESINDLNRNSSRTMLIQHNQVLLIGSDLAEQGVADWLDLLARSREGRLEVLFMVSDGPAENILNETMNQEGITGMYIAHMMQEMIDISPYYRIRMLDFMSTLRTHISSPIAPIVKMEDNGNGKMLRITGLAVFKEDEMVGRLTAEQFSGYVWTMGKVKGSGVAAQSDQGRVVCNIGKLTSEQEIDLSKENEVQLKIKVNAELSIGELHGFTDISADALLPYLKQLAQQQIKEQILDTFKAGQDMQTDIYGIGSIVSKKYPQQWKEIGKNWDEIFAALQPDITIETKITGTGEIMNSIEMKDEKNET